MLIRRTSEIQAFQYWAGVPLMGTPEIPQFDDPALRGVWLKRTWLVLFILLIVRFMYSRRHFFTVPSLCGHTTCLVGRLGLGCPARNQS